MNSCGSRTAKCPTCGIWVKNVELPAHLATAHSGLSELDQNGTTDSYLHRIMNLPQRDDLGAAFDFQEFSFLFTVMLSKCALSASYQLMGRRAQFKRTNALSKSYKAYKTQPTHPRALSGQHPLLYISTTNHFIFWRMYTRVASEPGKTSRIKSKKGNIKQKTKPIAKQDVLPREAFSELKDVNNLKLNQTITLPMLGPTLPRGLETQDNDTRILKPILLTRQRIEVLQKFYNEMKVSENGVYTNQDKGVILRGPTGQGKSVLSYLLACTAYANNCILVYIPNCADFVGQSDDGSAVYFLKRLLLFNSESLKQIPSMCNTQTLAEYISSRLKFDPIGAYDEALSALRSYTHRPVVHVLDEHTEIRKAGKETGSSIFFDWVRGYCGAHGDRTCIVYSGSAHYPFATKMTIDNQQWFVRLQPVPLESLPNFVLMGAFSLNPSLKELFEDKNMSDEAFAYLDFITHGNPREIRLLLKALAKSPSIKDIDGLKSSVEDWAFVRKLEIDQEVKKFVAEHEGTFVLRLFNSFLTEWFAGSVTFPPDEFADLGLLYELADGAWRMSSRQAHVAIREYFFSEVVPHLFMDSTLGGTIIGVEFKSLLLLELKKGLILKKKGGAWRFGNASTRQELHFGSCKEQTLLKKGTSKWDTPKDRSPGPTIFVPELSNFPYLDAVYHEPPSLGENGVWLKPHRLIFMQFTLLTPRQHEHTKGGIKKSLDEVIPQIIVDITGHNVKPTYNEETDNIECPSDHVSVEFVVFTWKTRKEATKLQPDHPSTKLPNNLLIVSKESLSFLPHRVRWVLF